MNTNRYALVLSLIWLCALTVSAQPSPPPLPPMPEDGLNLWPLETPPWRSFWDDPARAFTNLNVAPSWDWEGSALSVDTNYPAFLQLEVYEDGETNITFDSGSISIWCQPNWTSAADSGTGPGNWATLWNVGVYTSNASAGCWLLTIDPAGSNLLFVAQSGGTNQVLWTPVDFDAGDWHNIVLAYTPTNCCIYLEGQLAANAGPITCRPSDAVCEADGFFVGSLSTAGGSQFHGQLQYLETYGYQMSADAVAANYGQLVDYMRYFGVSPSIGGFQDDTGPPMPGGDGGGGGGEGGSGGTNSGGSNSFCVPTYYYTSNYLLFTNFWLSISNSATQTFVTIDSTLSNLTYQILTNDNLAAANGWGVWQTLLATNSLTPAPPMSLGSSGLFFTGGLVWSTGANGLPDWWQMEYFGRLGISSNGDAGMSVTITQPLNNSTIP